MARSRSESGSRNKAPLTSAETNSLLAQVRYGNDGAIEELVKRNNGLVLGVVEPFFPSGGVKGYAPDDLMQEGRVGLLRAINSPTYTAEKGQFAPYARICLQRVLINALHARRSIDDFRELEDLDEGELAEEVADPISSTPEEEVIFRELCEATQKVVSALNPAEREFAAAFFGLGTDEDKTGMTQTRLANERGVTRQAVSQFKIKFQKKLAQNPYFIKLWDEYLDL